MLTDIRDHKYNYLKEVMNGLWILAVSLVVIFLILTIIGLIHAKKYNLEESEGRSKKRYFAAINVLHVFFELSSVAIMIALASISIFTHYEKFKLLQEWATFADCVDEYM